MIFNKAHEAKVSRSLCKGKKKNNAQEISRHLMHDNAIN
jgi:hypothetical protein